MCVCVCERKSLLFENLHILTWPKDVHAKLCVFWSCYLFILVNHFYLAKNLHMHEHFGKVCSFYFFLLDIYSRFYNVHAKFGVVFTYLYLSKA